MEISEDALREIIQKGIKLGTEATLQRLGLIKPFMSYSEAIEAYGRGTVDRWVSEGLIEKIKDGTGSCKTRLDRERLQELSFISNRRSWFKHHKKID